MIKFITARNRSQYRALIDQMHQDRKRVFVDWLKWDIPVVGDKEIDQYDTDDAIYIIDVDAEGNHVASIRLLPCSVPTLMAEHFSDMVQSPVPADDTAWEMTRLCANPNVKDKLAQWTGRKNITVAAIEFALMRDIKQLIFVTHSSWVPTILSVKDGTESIAAMRINVTPETLTLIRRNWGVKESLLPAEETLSAVA